MADARRLCAYRLEAPASERALPRRRRAGAVLKVSFSSTKLCAPRSHCQGGQVVKSTGAAHPDHDVDLDDVDSSGGEESVEALCIHQRKITSLIITTTAAFALKCAPIRCVMEGRLFQRSL